MQSLAVHIIDSLAMTESYDDWSRVRSPARARRRLSYGYQQNNVIRQRPRKDAITLDGGRTYHMHPVTARECRRLLDEFHEGWKK